MRRWRLRDITRSQAAGENGDRPPPKPNAAPFKVDREHKEVLLRHQLA
jgi:hypothetical protein